LTPAQSIRKLYKPVQPTVSTASEQASYAELLPDARLQQYIYCYWQLKTGQPLSGPFLYRVVADGCIDIFFEPECPDESFVMGFSRKYTEFSLGNSFNYIGIRFLPTMFPQLFKVNAAALTDRFEPLEAVLPAMADFISARCSGNLGPDSIKDILDHYFLNLVSRTTFNYDNRLYEAIDIILQQPYGFTIEKGLDTGISPRQLRRLFECYIGVSAKTFSNVIRFQHILNAKPSRQSLRNNKLFFDAGYYDQAHFIKEFRNFYGTTPGKAFGE
jgi:AraC-like DNA-binding protein